jgi:hypothetical protein
MSIEKSTPPAQSSVNERTNLIVDPAQRYYKDSRDDWAEYERAVRDDEESSAHLTDRNDEPLGAWGNLRSKKGFDPDSFRNTD